MPTKASYSHSQQHFRVFKTGTMGENVCVAGENKHFASFSLEGLSSSLGVLSVALFPRQLTDLDKSSEFPALLYILTSRALIFPFVAKPT